MTVTDHWHELVTTALLGTDRRDPPPPPDVLADTIDDALTPTPVARLVTDVAATVVARRVGMRPGPPVPGLQAAGPDPRPLLTPAAARRWHRTVSEWPVLEDEFWLQVRRGRWRPSPDVLVAALRRHRGDRARWDEVMAVGGAAAVWLVEHRPHLGRAASGSRPTDADVAALGLDGLPALPVAPELVGVLTAGETAVVNALVALLSSGGVTMAHRNVLVNFVARCRRDVLTGLAAALRHEVDGPAITLALTLGDLALFRHELLAELEP